MSYIVGNVETIIVPESTDNDAVVVFLRDVDSKAGSITISCYGRAWAAYFGSHGGKSIKDFVLSIATTDYLVDKFQTFNHIVLKSHRKQEHVHLTKIVIAVKQHLKRLNHNDELEKDYFKYVAGDQVVLNTGGLDQIFSYVENKDNHIHTIAYPDGVQYDVPRWYLRYATAEEITANKRLNHGK